MEYSNEITPSRLEKAISANVQKGSFFTLSKYSSKQVFSLSEPSLEKTSKITCFLSFVARKSTWLLENIESFSMVKPGRSTFNSKPCLGSLIIVWFELFAPAAKAEGEDNKNNKKRMNNNLKRIKS